MRIARIRIENFRSFEILDIALPRICALVGANNSGKSNLLLAIKRVLGRSWISADSFSVDDIHGKDPFKDILIQLTLDSPISYQRFKYSGVAEVHGLSFHYTTYKVGDREGERRLEQACLNSKGKRLQVPKSAFKKGQKPAFEPLTRIPSEVQAAIPVIHIGTNRALRHHLPSSQYSLLRVMLESINDDFNSEGNTTTVRANNGEMVEMRRSERFQRFMDAAMELLYTDEFWNLENRIKKHALRQLGFDPEVDNEKLDLHFSPFSSMDFYRALGLRIKEDGFTIDATELGDGFQNALVIAILRAYEESKKKGAVFLVEEPEMFLHPQMQRSLHKSLMEIGNTNQVIYTTHSPHFVNVPEFHNVLMVRRERGVTSATSSSLSYDKAREERLIKEFDPERNELFFASRVLLVEGDTEKLALPEYARRLGHDLNGSNSTIVEVGGKRNLLEFARIVSSFGVPVGVLYDTDIMDTTVANVAEEINAQLDGLTAECDLIRVWSFNGNYEVCLRETMGQVEHQAMCQKYAGFGKAVKARLIAADGTSPIPSVVEEALAWLAGRSTCDPGV